MLCPISDSERQSARGLLPASTRMAVLSVLMSVQLPDEPENKVALFAHMDEVGIIVTYVEKNGFLRFAPVGGLDCYSLVNRQVIFENGIVGVVSYEGKIDIKKEGKSLLFFINL